MNEREYALETMDEGVLIIAGNGKIIYANSYARNILEITTDSDMFFKSILADTSGRNDEIIDMTSEVIYGDKNQESRIIHYVNHSGKQYSLLVSCTKMENRHFVFYIFGSDSIG